MIKIVFILFSLIIISFSQSLDYDQNCVAYSKKYNLCITPKEFESYYKNYKKQILSQVGKGNWYFTLADMIQAAKLLAFEKILYKEAKKSGIEKTKYFERYKSKIEKEYKSIDKYVNNLIKQGKISKDEGQILKKNLKERIYNYYLKKAYLEKNLEPYLKVTSEDINNFMLAHKGEYGFKKDPKHPKMKIISKQQLIEIIKTEKAYRVANEFSNYLWNMYNVTINTELLRKLEKKNN